MSILFASYIVNFLILVLLGGFFLRKYFNASWAFFSIFCTGTGLWFILYFLTYSWSDNHQTLIFLAQSSYAISLISLYSFLAFLFYFTKRKVAVASLPVCLYLLFSLSIFLLYTQTSFIVEGLYFLQEKNDWYETEWFLFPVHIILSLLFIPLSIYLGLSTISKVRYIDKRRIQMMLLWILSFVFLAFIFLLILPAFWYWFMEKYIAFFFLPFIVSVFYVIRHYNFLNIRIALMQILIFVYAMTCSFLILKILINFVDSLNIQFKNYWWITGSTFLIELTIWVLLFLWISRLLHSKLNSLALYNKFYSWLNEIREQIPFIMDLGKLNTFIKSEFKRNFSIKTARISLEWSHAKKIISFFRKYPSREYIICDTVFLEDYKKELWGLYKILKKYTDVYCIFPLMAKEQGVRQVIWILELGSKPYNDPFFNSEFLHLQSFSEFLSSHLKYIDIYKQIQDLTVSLDKKVDEKTIEYNNLLNKQKEFIAYVGHEIKNPVTNTLFLSDSLKESLSDDVDKEIREEAHILYDELVKVSQLVKYIFSAEKFDLDKVRLYREKVDLSQFLMDEVQAFRYKFPKINFSDDVANGVMFDIDTTQFRQVVQNLINNSIKFASTLDPRISIWLKKKWKKILLQIEDNWDGFENIDIGEVFWKYSTWWGSATWLWMWLYLCKKIVELHGWEIEASNSKNLWWACFSIKI